MKVLDQVRESRQFWQSLGQFIFFILQGLNVLFLATGEFPTWLQGYGILIGAGLGTYATFGYSKLSTGSPPPPKVS